MTVVSDEVLERLASDDVRAAREAISDIARETPVLTSRSLGEVCGGRLLLKAENLQRTGSFKLRGALHKIARLGADAERGVVAGSAGNHAQSLAYAARARGLTCEVYMPEEAAVAKVARSRASAAPCTSAASRSTTASPSRASAPPRPAPPSCTRSTTGRDPRPGHARARAGRGGARPGQDRHPGRRRRADQRRRRGHQGRAAGGGGGRRPGPRLRAVRGRAGRSASSPPAATIADGIAIKRPGEITLPLVQHLLDDMCTVGEEDVAEAIVRLLERAKLVVEGAGAVGVAALLAGAVRPAHSGATVVVLSGGNIDAGLLATVARRHETAAGRRLRIFTRISDRPGGLAATAHVVAGTGGNLVTVDHVRDAVELSVRETGVALTSRRAAPVTPRRSSARSRTPATSGVTRRVSRSIACRRQRSVRSSSLNV